MERGRHLADRIARRIDGTVRALPTETANTWVVIRSDGHVPVLVREFGPAVSITVWRSGVWTRPDAGFDEATVQRIALAARVPGPSDARDVPTPYGLALALADTLRGAFGETWTASIPGIGEPAEVWLHPVPFEAASVGVFHGRVAVAVGGAVREIAVPHRGTELHAPVVDAVRAQHAHHLRHVALTDLLHRIAVQLADALSEALGPCVVCTDARPDHVSPGRATITRRKAAVVRLFVEASAVRAHAGAEGPAGWDGDPSDTVTAVREIVAARARARSLLTGDKLVRGQRYRVIADFRELRAGDQVWFDRFEDIDNHYGRLVFRTADGREVEVAGDFSSPTHAPLADAYRTLAVCPDA